MKIRTALVSIVIGTAILAGCYPAYQVKEEPSSSGFLGNDYAKLKPGKGPDQAAQRYISPAADFGGYKAIYMAPVLFYSSAGKDLSPQNRQTLANNFYIALSTELGKDYKLVGQPQPDTMRLQFAITEATTKSVGLDTVSTILPIGLVVKAAKQKFKGDPGFTGKFAIEFKVTDATSGKLLAAGIDKRAGGLGFSGDHFEKWDDVDQIMDLYAKISRYRLCKERRDTDCVAPPTPSK